MKSFIYLLIFFFVVGGSSYAESLEVENLHNHRYSPQDSLGDLWVVVLDKSRSMQDPQNYLSVLFNDKDNKFPGEYINSKIDYSKDEFFFFTSGVVDNVYVKDNNLILDELGKIKDFTDSFIHPVNDISHCFSNGEALFSYIKDEIYVIEPGHRCICPYQMSFISLIRPLSMARVLKNDIELDFSKYNHIYHIIITDDGDDSFQWMIDHQTIQRFAPQVMDTICSTISHIASGDFSVVSEKKGVFKNIWVDNSQPRIYLTEYITVKSIDENESISASEFLEVELTDDEKAVVILKDIVSSDINLAFIKKFVVNGESFTVNQYLYKDSTLVLDQINSIRSFDKNEVEIVGHYQELYIDEVLGSRIRTFHLREAEFNNLRTSLYTTTMYNVKLAIVILLIIIIIFTLIWFNLNVLKIYTKDSVYRVSRIAMLRLKHDNFVLATFFVDKTIFLKRYGVRVKKVAISQDKADFIIINSRKPLIFSSKEGWYTISKRNSLGKITKSWVEDEINKLSNKDRKRIQSTFYYNYILDYDQFLSKKKISFSYSQSLDHDLYLVFKNHKTVKHGANNLFRTNESMIANHIDCNHLQNVSKSNCLLVNEVLNTDMDYIYVLNIFDTQHKSEPDLIYVKYYAAFNFNKRLSSEGEIVELFKTIIKNIKKDEKIKLGKLNVNMFDENQLNDSYYLSFAYSVFGSYLFIRTNHNLEKHIKRKKIYSPFKSGEHQIHEVLAYKNISSTLLAAYSSNRIDEYGIPFNFEIDANKNTLQKLELAFSKKTAKGFVNLSDNHKQFQFDGDSSDIENIKLIYKY